MGSDRRLQVQAKLPTEGARVQKVREIFEELGARREERQSCTDNAPRGRPKDADARLGPVSALQTVDDLAS